jgi:Ni,Fe-hydrogenase III small subunit/ferredoxin
VLKPLLARLRQGRRTTKYPKEPIPLPERFRGLPRLDATRCPEDCRECVAVCPYEAVTAGAGDKGQEARKALTMDLGKCIFCAECAAACPHGAITFTTDARLATRRREELILTAGDEYRLATVLDEKMRRIFGRSLKLREVSAAGCNACEADTNVLNTIGWDLGRFGIQFVASPRHADGVFITGPVSENMREALLKTYAGPFRGQSEVHNGATDLLPVDLFIPGCPPHPLTILDGLLRLLGRLDNDPQGPMVKPTKFI